MTQYGRAFTQSGSIYALGMAAIVPVGLVSIAVTTRYLSLAEYGRLVVLLAAAAVLTVFSGIGAIQGALIAAYGMGDDDGDADTTPAATPQDTGNAIAGDTLERQRLMGTGLLLIVALGSILCGAVSLFAHPISAFLLGSKQWSAEVQWMSLSAWTGAIWRMSHQVFRMERRAVVWSVLQWVRPVLVLSGTLAALVGGGGVNGVLGATAAATLLSTLLALSLSRGMFRCSPSVHHVHVIWSAGAPYIGLNVAQVVQQQIGILLLGVVATPAAAGVFQVAQKIASIPTYVASGLLAGWAPLERSPVSSAARLRKGVSEYNATIFTIYMLGNIFAVVSVALIANVAILLAAPPFSPAAQLVPVLGAAYLVDFAFRGVYRSSGFPGRRRWYSMAHLVWLAPYAIVAIAVVPTSPSYGAALAQVAGGITTTAMMVMLDRRGPAPRPYAWSRLGVAAFLGVVFVVAAQLVPGPFGVRLGVAAGLALVFPLALRLSGAVSHHQLGVIRRIVSQIVPRPVSRRELAHRLSQMSRNERLVFVRIAWERQDVDLLAATLGVSRRVVLARLTRGLRVFGGLPTRPTPVDHRIAAYVSHRGTTLERDIIAHDLGDAGADLLDLDDLAIAMRDAKLVRRRGTRIARRQP